ncbi:hypothetical protein KA071_02935, partial [Candidatus Gracilibacteria bacterium]|nr:hypothetical protein [Candidatus Gracilibacteria bacterium]
CLTFGLEINGFGGFSEVFNGLISSVHNNYNSNFWEALLLYPTVALVTTYPIFTLFSLYRVNYSRKFLTWGCVFAVIIIGVNLSSGALQSLYSRQINQAQTILSQEGENQKGFEQAQVWFLESAMLYFARHGSNYSNLFEKLYDSSLFEYFGERLGDSTSRWRSNSFATNASKVGDAANVLLTLGEIHSETEDGIVRTKYTFDFQNTTHENQEVVIFFQTPSTWSVVSELKLGLDLQLIGQVAPRGAAKRVYEESLRRNIDPALIEKVGLNSYSLRVFPIPSKTVSQGKQKVQVEILTPVSTDATDIVYAPKFSFINLRFDENSRAITKVYDGGKLIKEDVVEKNVEKYLKQEHMMAAPESAKNAQYIGDYCLPAALSQYAAQQFDTPMTDKITLFFDISKSAERNNVEKQYKNIYAVLKNYSKTLNDVDLYTFNFDVQRVSDVDNLSFWGYSDTDRIMNYIDKNGFQNQHIVIVTDDDSFNLSTGQYQIPTLQNIHSNRIDIIKIGDDIKRYKTDITNLVAATGGNVFEISDKADISTVAKKIKTADDMTLADGHCVTTASENKQREKILAGIIGNILLSRMTPQNQEEIFQVQNKLAETYVIVNQYNSLIALETARQQNDLNNYSNQQVAYETEFENFDTPSSPPLPQRGMREFEGDISNFKMSNDSSSRGIEPGLDRIDDGLRGPNTGGGFFGSGSSYRSRTYSSELNLGGIILLLIYLVEIVSCINFIFMVRKGRPEEKITNQK